VLQVKRLVAILFVSFLMISSFLIFSVRADPAAVLKVSLPEGSYVGYDNDPWLSECWLLNLTGASQTFILRINDTSKSVRSYDTHLIIALNDEGYNSLETLIINGTQVPKLAFRYGTPTPYNIWTWPSGDVYPTWFNDTYINVGTIERKEYVDLIVSITVSNATNVRVHFDAYGSRVSPPPPENVGDITHNSISQDSTVLLQPGPPPPEPPIASFYYTPQYPETNEIVTFNATESYDPDGYIVSYSWDFGDGTPKVTTSDPITNHTYTAFGDYTVTLTVTDNSGLTGEATSPIHVSQHPVASFTFTPTDPLVHETVTFNASASTPDGGTIVSYAWNFGDGNITAVSDPIITHAYSTYETYTVTLNITDSEGKWDTTSKQITVAGLPIADFFWSPYYPQRYENVTFDASTSTPDGGTIISYAWDFGDGTPTVVETDPITTHYYTATGNYTVTLNVTDSEGRWDAESKIITVVPIRYYLEVNTDPADITTIPGQGWYDEGTNVSLTAPDTVSVSTVVRYKFSHWTIDSASQGISVNPIIVFMDNNHTATAHYTLQYEVTFNQSGVGPDFTGTILTIDGAEYNISMLPATFWWENCSTHTFAFQSPLIAAPNAKQYVWTSTNGLTTLQSGTIKVSTSGTVTGNYKTQYYLTVKTDPASITTIAGEGWYDESTSVSLSAPAVANYQFSYWDVDDTSEGSGVNPIAIQINAPHTATAHYTQIITYTLTIETTSGGTATPAPGTYTYNAGSTVQVTAVPNANYVLDYWLLDGNNAGSANPYTVTMNNNHALKAVFKSLPPPLSVSISPPSATIVVGGSVTFTSTVSGGTTPYSYQWYLNGAPVSGATSSSWTFTPTASGTYNVYLKVTDANGTLTQSPTSQVTVTSIPVGGYSISLTKQLPISHMATYVALITLFGVLLSITKRKRK